MNQKFIKKKKIAEKILDYWYILEFLNQDALPRLSYEEKKKNEEMAKAVQRGQSGEARFLKLMIPIDKNINIPEQALAEARRHGMACLGNISVYAGKITRESCIQAIARRLKEQDIRPEKTRDEIACFSMQLSSDGILNEKTFCLSPVIWAVRQLEKAQDKSLADCLSHEAYREETEGFEKLLKNTDAEEAEAVNGAKIEDLLKKVNGEYIKGNLEAEAEFSYIMVFQAFKEEEAREKYEEEDYQGLGRNFFAEDIKLVLSKLQQTDFGCGNQMEESLLDYITRPYGEFYPEEELFSTGKRLDLEHPRPWDGTGRGLLDIFSNILHIQNAPLGKWPSRFMPALMQQTAVNLAVSNNMGQGSIFSVNGPPGTGKTTLLKEIIVDHIVNKAICLSKYKKPDDAFMECSFLHGEKKNNGYCKWYPNYYKFKNDQINDYSILVTSCNNAAVENITKELPLLKGITDAMMAFESDSQMYKESLEEVKGLFTGEGSSRYEEIYQRKKEKKGVYPDIYFTEYAKELLGGDEAWGLISAALGKKSNIHRFYQNVLSHLIADFYSNEKLEARLARYQRVRHEFEQQRSKVIRLKHKLEENCRKETAFQARCKETGERIRSLGVDIEQCERFFREEIGQAEALKKKMEAKQTLLKKKEGELRTARTEAENSREAVRKADQDYEEKLKLSVETRSKIKFLGSLFHKNDTRVKNELAEKYEKEALVWKQKAQELLEASAADQETADRLEREAEGLRQQLKEWETEFQELITKSARIYDSIGRQNEEIKKNERSLKNMQEDYAGWLASLASSEDDMNSFLPLNQVFMEKFLSREEKESTQAQAANPWFTSAYNRERERLFYLALQLTKEFILSSKCCFKNYQNLALLWKETKVDNETVSFHPQDREACFGPLLQTLFLLAPVVSTTFASAGNFLRDIKEPNVLGTLIVDEAGQAPPQMAVGALFRSRRAVIVGDPKQVEPVVTDELLLLKKAYQEDIYKPYKEKAVSVQQFADLINPYGTYMENEHKEKEWLGCPLLVHRRCISPMYDISNQISYNNTMKQQTGAPSEKKAEMFCYSGSRWINVKGREKGNKNHFVEEQAKRVAEILEIAFSKSDEPSMFIITPFTSVKAGMLQYLEGRLKLPGESVLSQKRNQVKAWMYQNIGTVHTFQGKEASEVIFLLGCDASREASGAVLWVNANIVNVAVTRAKYRLYVIGDEAAWMKSSYISQAKAIIDLYALKEMSRVLNNEPEESREETGKKVRTLFGQLPGAEFVALEPEEKEDGETGYSPCTEVFLDELRSGELLLYEITEEQLKGYGFTRETFHALHPQVREHVEWGIKLYSMLKKLKIRYQIEGMDASCCAILFCKAIELQVKECFYDSFKLKFPNHPVTGNGKVPLTNADKKMLTLGTFCQILRSEDNKKLLAGLLAGIQRGRYDMRWWNQFGSSLDECRKLRNKCCHCDPFTWSQTNQLMLLLFVGVGGKGSVEMNGLLRESEIGKRLGK